MAFPGTYIVRGTKGAAADPRRYPSTDILISKQIKQLGNAVTPPAMKLLIQRVVQFLSGERRVRVRAA